MAGEVVEETKYEDKPEVREKREKRRPQEEGKQAG